MKKRNRLNLYFVLLFLLSGFIPADKDIYLEISKSIEIFGKVYKEITLNYVDKINAEEIMTSGIKGMLDGLDPYTVFLDESMQKDFDVLTNGKYGGIGTSVGIRNDKVTIIDILDDSPADRQGIKIGDVILEVNDKKIQKSNFEKMTSEIAGAPGKVVKILIHRDGHDDPITFLLQLEVIEIKNITYYGFYPEESSNVYIKLSNFSKGAGQEVKQALIELNKLKKIKSVILDLRNNPGGLLDQAIDVSEKFLNKGKLIVSVAGRDSAKKTNYYSQEEPLIQDELLCVLVNENSASAAEIVAGAIQDHDRGIIIGKNTFGKGLVQTIVPISNKTSLKITTARYFTPSGRCIQKIDYSNHQEISEQSLASRSSKYFTDNNRKVFSYGGITPDTIVENFSNSEVVNDIKVKGLFFQFANFYSNKNENIDYRKVNDEKLFTDFKEYLNSKDYYFISDLRNSTIKLSRQFKGNNAESEISKQFDLILNKLEMNDMKNVDENKKDIIFCIKDELFNRIISKSLRFKYLLQQDAQLKATLSLINEKQKIDLLLRNN